MTVKKAKCGAFRCSKHGTFYATGNSDKLPPCFICTMEAKEAFIAKSLGAHP